MHFDCMHIISISTHINFAWEGHVLKLRAHSAVLLKPFAICSVHPIRPKEVRIQRPIIKIYLQLNLPDSYSYKTMIFGVGWMLLVYMCIDKIQSSSILFVHISTHHWWFFDENNCQLSIAPEVFQRTKSISQNIWSLFVNVRKFLWEDPMR